MQLSNSQATMHTNAKTIEEANMAALKILIVDGNADICAGLCAILGSHDDIDVVAATVSVAQAAEELRDVVPDIVLIDAQAIDESGVDEIQNAVGLWPATKLIALAVHSSVTNAALAAGADEVLMKDTTRQLLLDSVRSTTKPNSRSA